MRLAFYLYNNLDNTSAQLVHALQMCDSYGRYLRGDVGIVLPFGKIPVSKANDVATNELGRKPLFSLHPLPMQWDSPYFRQLVGWKAVRSVLSEVNADINVTLAPMLLDALVRQGRSVIFEAHNSRYHKNSILNLLFCKRVVQLSLRPELRIFVTISEALRKHWIAQGVPAQKTMVAHDAVDSDWLTPVDGSICRTRHGISADRKLVLYSGSLYADRSVERIVRLAAEMTEADFMVIGWPLAAAETLRTQIQAKRLANISVVDRVPHRNVREYLAAADILLMIWSRKVPTINYCSPMKLFEYMAAGKIIVGDGFPTIREVLRHGTHALLAEPENYDDLKAKLSIALSMPENHPMSQASYQLALKEYTWDIRAKRILQFAKVL